MVEGRTRKRMAEMGGVSESAALPDSTLSASKSTSTRSAKVCTSCCNLSRHCVPRRRGKLITVTRTSSMALPKPGTHAPESDQERLERLSPMGIAATTPRGVGRSNTRFRLALLRIFRTSRTTRSKYSSY